MHNYACSITIGVDSISSSSLGLSWSPSVIPSLQVSVAMLYYGIVMALLAHAGSPPVSSFSSGECGNVIQYCYGFNRHQLWLLAQGLLQSVPFLLVSVAIP